MSRPFVTIIVPTYNQAPLLRKALESVRQQTVLNWEAEIINNFSDDDTVSIVEGFKDSRFKLTNFKNDGIIAASRNKGIEAARGDWVAFLDSDDLWRPEKLDRCLAAISDESEILSHREETFQNGEVISVSPHYKKSAAEYRSLLFKGNCFSPSATVVRKSLLAKVGGFSVDPAITTCEDYDLWLRLAQTGAKVQFIDDVLSDYRLHGANNSGATLRHMKAGLYAVGSHYDQLRPKRMFDFVRFARRRAKIIYGAARNFQASGCGAEARKYFVKSFRAFPFSIKTVVGGIMTLNPNLRS